MDVSHLHQEGSSGPPLHYLQEISRKDVEIKELRNQQYQAETSLRELQLNISVKEEKYQDRTLKLSIYMIFASDHQKSIRILVKDIVG